MSSGLGLEKGVLSVSLFEDAGDRVAHCELVTYILREAWDRGIFGFGGPADIVAAAGLPSCGRPCRDLRRS